MFSKEFQTSAATRRWDLYGPVHKGLRLAHLQMIARLGQGDYAGDTHQLLADLRAHLVIAETHLIHEEAFVHTALTSAPDGLLVLNEQHERHRSRLAELGAMIEALKAAAPGERETLGRMLYLAFSAFVAEDLEHMVHEETEIWPLLCALFTDEQLADIEMRIIATLTPEDSIATMRMILPALGPSERAELLRGMKAASPPPVYAAVIAQAAQPTLPAVEFAKLQRIGLAA